MYPYAEQSISILYVPLIDKLSTGCAVEPNFGIIFLFFFFSSCSRSCFGVFIWCRRIIAAFPSSVSINRQVYWISRIYVWKQIDVWYWNCRWRVIWWLAANRWSKTNFDWLSKKYWSDCVFEGLNWPGGLISRMDTPTLFRWVDFWKIAKKIY